MVKPMPKEMKEKLQKERLIHEIRERIIPDKAYRTKFPEPKKVPLILPEDFTGTDLKRTKKLMKGHKK